MSVETENSVKSRIKEFIFYFNILSVIKVHKIYFISDLVCVVGTCIMTREAQVGSKMLLLLDLLISNRLPIALNNRIANREWPEKKIINR